MLYVMCYVLYVIYDISYLISYILYLISYILYLINDILCYMIHVICCMINVIYMGSLWAYDAYMCLEGPPNQQKYTLSDSFPNSIKTHFTCIPHV